MKFLEFFIAALNFSFANPKNFAAQPKRKDVDAKMNIFAQGFLILASVFISTSAYSQQAVDDQYVLNNTKLSISPSGEKILITYGLKSEKPTSIVVQRENGKFVSKPLAPFDRALRHLGFASNEQNLLEVSREESITTLARLNIDTGEKETIYKDPQDIWMPREIGLNDYVYFQATKQIPTQGIWVRQQNGVRKTLFPVPDRLSSTMNWTGESLYLMNWTNPRSFFALTGAVPAEAEKFANSSRVWEISCSNSNPVQCAIKNLIPSESGYLSTVEITKGLQVCAAPGQWFGLRELQISENGNHVIFHAKKSGSNGLRGVYLASYAEKECRLELVFLEKDEKWELQ